jgi:hypothetical protein
MRILDVYPGSEFFPSRLTSEGSVMRILDVYPDPNFFIPDPGSEYFPHRPGSASKNFSIVTPKIVSKLPEI